MIGRETSPAEAELRRRSLLRLLRPNDVLMFEDNGGRAYFFVERIHDGRVDGEYVDPKIREKRSMLLEAIASRDFYVGYLKKILSSQ